MWFCVGLPNFIQLGPPPVELRRHQFSRWRHGIADLLLAAGLVTSLIGVGRKVEIWSWPNVGEIWLRYYYFRFLNTNGRHSGWQSGNIGRFGLCFGMIRAIISPSFVDSSRPKSLAFNHKSNTATAAILDCYTALVDYPRVVWCHVDGQNKCRKFYVNRLSSFWECQCFISVVI